MSEIDTLTNMEDKKDATLNDQSRISAGNLANLEIQTRRIRTCIDELSLNRDINKLILDYKSAIDTQSEKVGNLPKSVAEKIFAFYKNSAEDAKESDLYDFEKHSAVLKCLSQHKYRISPTALVALGALLEQIIHKMSVDAIAATQVNKGTDIKVEFLKETIPSAYYFPLFSKLPTYLETSDDDSDDVSFTYCINSLMSKHIVTQKIQIPGSQSGAGKTIRSARVTHSIKTYISNLIREFLVLRVSNYLTQFMSYKNVKTVDSEVILIITKLMLTDLNPDFDFSLVEDYVRERLDRYDLALKTKDEASLQKLIKEFQEKDEKDLVKFSPLNEKITKLTQEEPKAKREKKPTPVPEAETSTPEPKLPETKTPEVKTPEPEKTLEKAKKEKKPAETKKEKPAEKPKKPKSK